MHDRINSLRREDWNHKASLTPPLFIEVPVIGFHESERSCICVLEEFEDTKGAIRIRKSKKNKQHNGQKKKYKRTSNDLQNMHIKLKIE